MCTLLQSIFLQNKFNYFILVLFKRFVEELVQSKIKVFLHYMHVFSLSLIYNFFKIDFQSHDLVVCVYMSSNAYYLFLQQKLTAERTFELDFPLKLVLFIYRMFAYIKY